MPLTHPQQMLYSAVRIVALGHDGSISFGTGFFWRFGTVERVTRLVVTNKHVLQGCKIAKITCHIDSDTRSGHPSDELADINTEILESSIIFHPDDDVDLCAFPIELALIEAENIGKSLFFKALSEDLIPSDSALDRFDALEDVYMAGCPNGLYDEVNGLPILRRGITASPIYKRYRGADEFLVDMACFPGSSGSPVFFYKNDLLLFLGILYAGPTIINSGIVLGRNPEVEVASMMHLGQVIRASRMREMNVEIQRRFDAQS